MHDETERGQHADIAVLEITAAPGLDAWTVRITVPHVDGPVRGWAPVVFWTAGAAKLWLDARRDLLVRPGVRDCDLGPNDLAYGVVVDDAGDDLLVSEPLPRVKAAGVAAMFAQEFRDRSR